MKKLSLAIIAVLGLSVSAFAQGVENNDDTHDVTIVIPEVALLDIEPTGSKNITQTFDKPTEAGLGLTAPTANSSLWLNYSSIVTVIETSRTISVKATALVPGVNIAISAGTPGGTGTLGTPVAVATLATTDAPIMSGVGSCYTGDGAVGSNLTYTLTTPTGTYANLVAASTTITVTYTLSDN